MESSNLAARTRSRPDGARRWWHRRSATKVPSRRAAAWLAVLPCAAVAACGTVSGPAAAGDALGSQAGLAAAAPAGWGPARQVPGTETMSQQAEGNDGKSFVGTGITSVACPARGDCAASGGYVDGGFNFLVFAGSQHGGKWAPAAALPGDAALVGHGGVAGSDEMWSGPFLSQVSCPSTGNCAIAGNYQDASTSGTRPLLDSQRAGKWGQVHPLSHATALLTISCPAAGTCAAGGLRQVPATTPGGAFVVSEKGGAWGATRPVTGTDEPITTMSCGTAGNCLAGGAGYLAGGGFLFRPTGTAFLVSERNGRWAAARAVPGLSRLAGHRASAVDSVSCVAGDCTAGGSYVDASGRAQVFVATERGGVWGNAQPLPGLAALNKGGLAEVTQVSCAGAGSCAIGGSYGTMAHRQFTQGWVATETGGRWGKAVEVARLKALNTAGLATVSSVSCRAAECVAGGWYTTGGTQHAHGFLVSSRHGRWGTAAQPPGLAALNSGGQAQVTSVSCAPSGWCTAVGDYTDAKTFELRMFVVSQR